MTDWPEGSTEYKPERSKRPSQAKRLAAKSETIELWRSPDMEPFASVPVNGHIEHCGVRSRRFRFWLRNEMFNDGQITLGRKAVDDFIETLAARATFSANQFDAHLRVADVGAAHWLDLADDSWRAVRIDPKGWQVIERPPVKFVRPKGKLALPAPKRGGTIDDLRGFLNVATEADFYMVVAWLLAALWPTGPYPILVISGEHGSAKSTTARLLRSIIDPNVAPIRTPPRDDHDLMIAARNGHVIGLDNISELAWWLSDCLCRLSTGGGFGTRALFTDEEEILFEATRPIIVNGIGQYATRSDLADRALIVSLPALEEDRRRAESDFWTAWERKRPFILGALLDVIVAVRRRLPTVKMDRLPRMADFARLVVAAEEALGWPAGSFMSVYCDNRATGLEAALESDPVIQAVRDLSGRDGFEGSYTDLLRELSNIVGEAMSKSRIWPSTPNALSNRIHRAMGALRSVGVDVQDDRVGRGKERRRIVLIRRLPK